MRHWLPILLLVPVVLVNVLVPESTRQLGAAVLAVPVFWWILGPARYRDPRERHARYLWGTGLTLAWLTTWTALTLR